MITEAGAPLTSNEGACPDGYTAYGPSCYRYFPPNAVAPSWSTAQQVCKDNSAQLVEISSVYEDGFVQALVADSAPNGYWIDHQHAFISFACTVIHRPKLYTDII